MKRTLLWICLCLVVALILIAAQVEATAAESATPVPTPATVTPEPPPGATRVRETDGAVMVYVPAGMFYMGQTIGAWAEDASSAHYVSLDAYWIDRTEVTNHQFEKFVQATGYRTEAEKEGTGWVSAGDYTSMAPVKGADWHHPEGPDSSLTGRADDPVLQVSWNDAAAYCQWAGARLPTEAQWEHAACGGGSAREYPWGNQKPSCEVTVMNDSSGEACGQGTKPWPVGSKPAGAGPYGTLDMSGNVWQWVADVYSEFYYGQSPMKNPENSEPGITEYRSQRGGAWIDEAAVAENTNRCAFRGQDTQTDRTNFTGFRCAVAASALTAPAVTVITPTVSAAVTPTTRVPARVLFIGDSWSVWLHKYFPELAASASPSITVESKLYSIGGTPLWKQWVIPAIHEDIHAGKWDVVVLQEDMEEYWQQVDQYLVFARKFYEDIKGAGAETVLYMHWPYKYGMTASMEELDKTYSKLGAQLGVKVAPAGLAWQRAAKERPDMELYAGDGIHFSPYGYYLMLCVLYGTIYDKSPVGLSYRMADMPNSTLGSWFYWYLPNGWQLTEDEAAFLQRIAWETVQEYEAGR